MALMEVAADPKAGQGLVATCECGTLRNMVRVVSKALTARSTLPILSHIIVEARDTEKGFRLRLDATDLETRIAGEVGAEITAFGRIAVHGKSFEQLLATMPPNAMVTVSGRPDMKVEVRCERSKYTLLGVPAEDFPVKNVEDPIVSMQIGEGRLKRLTGRVMPAMATDETRAVLAAMLFRIKAGTNKLVAVATDTHRLAASVEDCAVSETPDGIDSIVPGSAIRGLIALLGDGEGEVQIRRGGAWIRFTLPSGTEFETRLVSGSFPNYERVIPTETAHVVTVGADELAQVYRRVAIVAREASNRAIIELTPGQMAVRAESQIVGSAHEEVQAISVDSPGLVAAINYQFVIDAVSALAGERVALAFTDPMKPCLLYPVTEDGSRGAHYSGVLMPMAIL